MVQSIAQVVMILGDSLKLSELINKADGLLGDAYLERVDIVRIKARLYRRID